MNPKRRQRLLVAERAGTHRKTLGAILVRQLGESMDFVSHLSSGGDRMHPRRDRLRALPAQVVIFCTKII
eukprot:4041815-Pleurochrysis_carterae.AAC.3